MLTTPVRLSDFWERLDAVLGPEYSRSWASDHVIATLGERTVEQAIAAGIDTRDIWREVCTVIEVPPLLT